MKTQHTLEVGENVYCESQPNNIGIIVSPQPGGQYKVNFGTKKDPIERFIDERFLIKSKYSQDQINKIRAAAPELLNVAMILKRYVDVGEQPTNEEIKLMDKAIKKATE